LRSAIDVHIEDNQVNYDAISESRDKIRDLIARYCGQCPGVVEGICPNLSAE
jgi:hypothetical protein